MGVREAVEDELGEEGEEDQPRGHRPRLEGLPGRQQARRQPEEDPLRQKITQGIVAKRIAKAAASIST